MSSPYATYLPSGSFNNAPTSNLPGVGNMTAAMRVTPRPSGGKPFTHMGDLYKVFGLPNMEDRPFGHQDHYPDDTIIKNFRSTIETVYANRSLVMVSNLMTQLLTVSEYSWIRRAFGPPVITNEHNFAFHVHENLIYPMHELAYGVLPRSNSYTSWDFTMGMQTYGVGFEFDLLTLEDQMAARELIPKMVYSQVLSVEYGIILRCSFYIVMSGAVNALGNPRAQVDDTEYEVLQSRYFAALNKGPNYLMAQLRDVISAVSAPRTLKFLVCPPRTLTHMTSQLPLHVAPDFQAYAEVQDNLTKQMLNVDVVYRSDKMGLRVMEMMPEVAPVEMPDLILNSKERVQSPAITHAPLTALVATNPIKAAQASMSLPLTPEGKAFPNHNDLYLYSAETDNPERLDGAEAIQASGIFDASGFKWSERLLYKYSQNGGAGTRRPPPESHPDTLNSIRARSHTPGELTLPDVDAGDGRAPRFLFDSFNPETSKYELAQYFGDMSEFVLPNSYVAAAARRMLASVGTAFNNAITRIFELVTQLNKRRYDPLWIKSIVEHNIANIHHPTGNPNEYAWNLEIAPFNRKSARFARVYELPRNAYGGIDLPPVPPEGLPLDCIGYGCGNGPMLRTLAALAQSSNGYGMLVQTAYECVREWDRFWPMIHTMLSDSAALDIEAIPPWFHVDLTSSDNALTRLIESFGEAGTPLFLRIREPGKRDADYLKSNAGKVAAPKPGDAVIASSESDYVITVLGNGIQELVAKASPATMDLIRAFSLPATMASMRTALIAMNPAWVAQKSQDSEEKLHAMVLYAILNDALTREGGSITVQTAAKAVNTFYQTKENVDQVNAMLAAKDPPAARAQIVYLLRQLGYRFANDAKWSDFATDDGRAVKVIALAEPESGSITIGQAVARTKISKDQKALTSLIEQLHKSEAAHAKPTLVGAKEVQFVRSPLTIYGAAKVRELLHATDFQALPSSYKLRYGACTKNEADAWPPTADNEGMHKLLSDALTADVYRASGDEESSEDSSDDEEPRLQKSYRGRGRVSPSPQRAQTGGIGYPGSGQGLQGADLAGGQAQPFTPPSRQQFDAPPQADDEVAQQDVFTTPSSSELPEVEGASSRGGRGPASAVFFDVRPRSAKAHLGVPQSTGPSTIMGMRVQTSTLMQELPLRGIHGKNANFAKRLEHYNRQYGLRQTAAERVFAMSYLTSRVNKRSLMSLANTGQLLPCKILYLRMALFETALFAVLGDGAAKLYMTPADFRFDIANGHEYGYARSRVHMAVVPIDLNGCAIVPNAHIRRLLWGLNHKMFHDRDHFEEVYTRGGRPGDPSILAMLAPVTEPIGDVIRWDGEEVQNKIFAAFNLGIQQTTCSSLEFFYRDEFAVVTERLQKQASATTILFDGHTYRHKGLTNERGTFMAFYTGYMANNFIWREPHIVLGINGEPVTINGTGPLGQANWQQPGCKAVYQGNEMYFPSVPHYTHTARASV